MIINLSPQYSDAKLSLTVQGETLIINGAELDLSQIEDGTTVPDLGQFDGARTLHPFLAGPLERVDGVAHITLILPYTGQADDCVAFPEPLVVSEDGPVNLPFSAYSEAAESVVAGGRNITTTTYRWRHDPAVTVLFVADPAPETEEAN